MTVEAEDSDVVTGGFAASRPVDDVVALLLAVEKGAVAVLALEIPDWRPCSFSSYSVCLSV
jgi:hypothetical protein